MTPPDLKWLLKRYLVGHPVLCDLQFSTEPPCTERKPPVVFFVRRSSQEFGLECNELPQAQVLLRETLEKLEMSFTVKTCCGQSSEGALGWNGTESPTEWCKRWTARPLLSPLKWPTHLIRFLHIHKTKQETQVYDIWDATSPISMKLFGVLQDWIPESCDGFRNPGSPEQRYGRGIYFTSAASAWDWHRTCDVIMW